MATNIAQHPQILQIENDLRYLTEALATNHHSHPKEQKKILTTHSHLDVTCHAFQNTIKQTQDAKEDRHIRSRTQIKCYRKFISDLDIAWGAYDALANAVKDLDTEIEQSHLTNPDACMLDRAANRGTQKSLAPLNEREIAVRAPENSDKLHADVTELEQLESACQDVVSRLEVSTRRSCVVDLVMRRV